MLNQPNIILGMTDNLPKPLPSLTEADIARFWSHVDVRSPDECWPWKLSRFRGGYGQFKIRGRNLKAHRIAFFLSHGYDSGDLLTCHTCDNPPCCNGRHLVEGTPAFNTNDSKAKCRLNTAAGTLHGSRTKPESRARGERVAGALMTAEKVIEMRALYATGEWSQQAIADRFGMSREGTGTILRGERWAHIPFDPTVARQIASANKGKPGEQHGTARLTESQVRDIRRRHAIGGVLLRQLAEEFGVTIASVSSIVRRQTWKHVS